MKTITPHYTRNPPTRPNRVCSRTFIKSYRGRKAAWGLIKPLFTKSLIRRVSTFYPSDSLMSCCRSPTRMYEAYSNITLPSCKYSLSNKTSKCFEKAEKLKIRITRNVKKYTFVHSFINKSVALVDAVISGFGGLLIVFYFLVRLNICMPFSLIRNI